MSSVQCMTLLTLHTFLTGQIPSHSIKSTGNSNLKILFNIYASVLAEQTQAYAMNYSMSLSIAERLKTSHCVGVRVS